MYRASNLESIKILNNERSEKVKEGVRYNAVPPPAADLYLSFKKDLSWTGLPEFVDDTVTDYSRPSPTVASTSAEDQNKDTSTSEDTTLPNPPKLFVKFVKPKDSQPESKSKEQETPKKSQVKYPEQNKHSNKQPKGNQRNWNNLKSYQLGPEFVLHKKPCFNCGDFSHLANDYNSCEGFQVQQAEGFTAFPFLPISAMKGKAVKHSACWTWNPSQKLSNKGNISYLSDFKPFDGGYVSFGQGGCRITSKGTIKTSKLEFENVYFVRDLKYNLFSVSQICDNKNSVLFTDTECIVLGRKFKLLDDTNILLRTPRQHNMYSIDLNNIVPHKDLTCLVAKASADECILWHRRLGKQHKASCKSKLVNSMTKPLHTLHMDLFGPTSVISIIHKWYCLVVTDDFSRFTWTFFLRSKDETSDILKKFITEVENLKDYKVKIIRVLVNKSQNKTPYELFNGRAPAIGFLKPFGCHVMILNTLDNLGKFEAKGDEGYFIGYSMASKAFRVFNKRTRRVRENLHVEFLENKVIEQGAGPTWLFDIDSLTKSMNYVPVDAGTNSTNLSGTKDAANQEVKKNKSSLRYIVLPNWAHDALLESTLMESPISTVSSPVPTACLNDSSEPSSEARLVSKRVANQEETPSLDNILSLTNRFDDILGVSTSSDEIIGVEADVSNMETSISASPTPTLRIHKDHPKKPKKVSDALQDPSWVEAMQEELLQFKIQKVWTLVDCPRGMDVKSAFLYGTIDEEVYVMQPPGFHDPVSLNTPMDKENPWGKDGSGKDVELHLYRSMIGSLMYLTASRPDI
nr:hypothetical protein [Tanacetum cinerariifolium]